MSKNKKNEEALRQLTERASLLHKNADLLSAEKVYSKILALAPYHFEALCGLSHLKLQSRQLGEALDLIRRALFINEKVAIAHRLSGEIQMASGHSLGALESFDKALALTPDDAELLFFRGVILRGLGRNEEALEAYEQALLLVPGKAELLCNYGNVLNDLQRYEEALACFEQALQVAPHVALLHYNRGNSLLSLERYREALNSFDAALRLDPGHPGIWSNRSNALRAIGRAEEALASADRALALAAHFGEALVSRGNALLDLNKPQEAMETLREAVTVMPSNASAYNGLGRAKQRLGFIDDAALQFERAIIIEPNFEGAHYNLALLRLQQGHYAQGWIGYEARLADPNFRASLRKDFGSVDLFMRRSRWKGPGTLLGKVGIWCEQGIGDQILFSTLLPELVETSLPFVYEVDQRLLPAYQRVFPAVNFVGSDDPPDAALTTASAALFCGSLPGLFRPSVESFARQPRRILQAAPERAAHYRSRLGDGFKLALSWRSARAGRLGRDKSATLADFAPLLAVPGVRGIDVQYGDTVAEREGLPQTHGVQIEHVEGIDFYNDLDEVLAILEACDLLITTSNANAHLAAALGKPVWLLYPSERAPFHYWAHGGDHRCLWYPSVEIISGLELTDWPRLVARAAERLRDRVAESAV